MSEKNILVDGLPQIVSDDILKLDVNDGDCLVVNIPPVDISEDLVQEYMERVSQSLRGFFSDKDIKILVLPHGMEVQVISKNTFNDKVVKVEDQSDESEETD